MYYGTLFSNNFKVKNYINLNLILLFILILVRSTSEYGGVPSDTTLILIGSTCTSQYGGVPSTLIRFCQIKHPQRLFFADDGDNKCNSMQYRGLSRDPDLRKFISALSITVHKLSGNKTVLLQKTGLDALVIDNMRKL